MVKSGSSIVLPVVYFDHIIEWNHIGYISTHLLFWIRCLNRFDSEYWMYTTEYKIVMNIGCIRLWILKSQLLVEEIAITPNSLTGLRIWIVIYITVIRKLKKILLSDIWNVWNKTGILFILNFLTYQIKIYVIKLVELSRTKLSWEPNFQQTVTKIGIPKVTYWYVTCWCK